MKFKHIDICRNENLFITDEKKFTKQFAASSVVLFDSPFRIREGIMLFFS